MTDDMEKRNVIEEGRTPASSDKMAEVVDAAVDQFDTQALKKEADNAKPAVPAHD